MFVVLVVSQAYVLRETVAVLQQRGRSTAGGLFERSTTLIAAIAFFNLNYAIKEIKVILPWVPKSPRVVFGLFHPVLALGIVPLFTLCYPIYKHLKTDVWNAIDFIYISLVWASLGFHIRLLALLFNRSAENVASSVAAAATTTESESLSTLSHTALNIAGWSIIFIGLRLLTFFRSTHTIGPIIAMIMAIVRDMLPFVAVLALLIFFGALAMPLLMGVLDKVTINADGPMAGDGFADPQRSFLSIFMWINGDWDAEAFEKNYGALAYFYGFLFLASIIMMNLLIAIMGDSFDRVREQQTVQSRIVLAQIIHEMESAMPKNDKSRPRWHRCLPKRLKPWCKDDRELNPAAVLWVVKGTGADRDNADDAEWGGRLAEVRKTMDAQFKVMRQESEDRAAKTDASAAGQVADLRREIKEIKEATKRADVNMGAIRALLEGGGGGGGGGATHQRLQRDGESVLLSDSSDGSDDESATVSRRTVGAAGTLLSRAYSKCPAEEVMENNVVEEKGGAEGRSGETIGQQSSDSDADVVI